MKNILAFSLITVVFICYCNGEIAYKNAHDLIEVIQNKAKVYGLDDMPTIIENRDTLKGIPEFKILENEVCSDWESAVNSLSATDQSQISKCILFLSLESLPPDAYVNFIGKAEDMFQRREIDEHLFLKALFPNDNITDFIRNNHANNNVVKILRKT